MGECIAPDQDDRSTIGSVRRADRAPEAEAVSGAAAARGDHAQQPPLGVHRFAVFLSHNSRDKPIVERVAEKLRTAGLEPWLDRWYLTGGGVWQEDLAAALRASDTCAVFVGPNGFGDWAREELGVAQNRAAKDHAFRLIPVLLPGLPDPFDPSTILPPFLSTRMWVDLRAGVEDSAGFQRLVSAITGVPPGPLRPAEPQDQTPPYRGLQPFGEEQAPFFFGRDADVQRLLEKLKGSRFLAVLGPSGSGKSSLVRAGLVPALRRSELTGSSTWPVRLLKPGARPLEGLALCLAQLSGSADLLGVTRQFRAHLGDDPEALHLAIRLAPHGAADGARTVLVVDQFEEVFTLCRDEAERSQFLANLVYAATAPDGACVVILTLRADFYQRCASYPELAGQVTAQQYLVSPMSAENLRQVVEEPAHRVGLDFEPGLVDAILQDVAAEPGVLPLLEHALWELWQRRRGQMLTFEGYRKTGGVAGALAKRADETYQRLGDSEQRTAQRILLRLTEPGEGTEDTRRRATAAELISRADERPRVEAVVGALVDARLLTTSGDERTGEQTVEVAHEALIRGWPMLRTWIEENRAGLRVQRRLSEAALDWRQSDRDAGLLYRGARLASATEWRRQLGKDGRPNDEQLNELEREFLDASVALEQRERREAQHRVRRTIGGLVGALAVILAVAIYAVVQSQEAVRQRDVAVTEANALATAEALANDQRNAAEIAKNDAVQARNDAIIQARIALSRQLAAQALSGLNDRVDFTPRPGCCRDRNVNPIGLSLLLSRQAYQVADTLEARTSLFTALAFSPGLTTFLRGHTDVVTSVAYSPDGKILASGSQDGSVRLWTASTGLLLGELIRQGPISSLVFSPDGAKLAVGTDWGQVHLWDTATRARLGEPLNTPTGRVYSVAFSPDGKTLALGSDDASASLWDVDSRQPIGEPLRAGEARVYSVAFSPDGKTLAAGSDEFDKRVWLWDLSTRRVMDQLSGHTSAVRSVAFSPDGALLATGSSDRTVRIWNLSTGQELGQPLRGHTDNVTSVAFGTDGTTVASGSDDATVRLWDIRTFEQIGPPLRGHTDRVTSVAFSSDGKNLAAGSEDQTVGLWKVTGEMSLPGATGLLAGAGFTPDGRTLVAEIQGPTVRLWDAATRQSFGKSAQAHANVRGVVFSPRGDVFATGSDDGIVRLWDVATLQLTGELRGHTQPVFTVAFSSDGKMLASGSEDKTVRLWDVDRKQPLGEPLLGPMDWVLSVAFSSDGRMLAGGGRDERVWRWDVATHKSIGQPLHHAPLAFPARSPVTSVAFSPGGKVLASGADDSGGGTVQLWDVDSGHPLGDALRGHTAGVASIAFSPDGRMLASGGGDFDGTLRLWDVATHQPFGDPMGGSTAGIVSLTFSPDGRNLVSTSQHSVQIWDVSLGTWLERACQIANRNLTQAEWKQYIGADTPYQSTCPDLLPGA